MNFNLLFFIFNLIFLGSLLYYFFVIRREVSDEHKIVLEEEKSNEEKVVREEKEIKEELVEAHKRSLAILSQSENIARDLITELETVLGSKKEELKLDFGTDSNFEIELGKLSTKIKSTYMTRINDLLEGLNNFQVDQAQKVQEFAEEQMVTTDKNLQQMRVEQLEQVRQRIERYKEEELALFDRKVKEVIDKAAQEVLGKSLTGQEQDILISRSLEKAKAEGIL